MADSKTPKAPESKTSKNKLIAYVAGGLFVLFLLTWGIGKLLSAFLPEDKDPLGVADGGERRTRLSSSTRQKYIHIRKIYGVKPKGGPDEKPWVGRKPNLPSHEELMRRVKAQRTYARNLPPVRKPGSKFYRLKRSDFRNFVKGGVEKSGALFWPHLIGGRPMGMKVREVKPGSFYERLGLYKGDILMNINGRRVNAPGHAFKYYRRIVNASRNLTLRFKRGGKTYIVDFDLMGK